MNHVWTTKQVETLERLVKDGLTTGVIASELGISRNSVCGKIKRMGLRLKRAGMFKRQPTGKVRQQEEQRAASRAKRDAGLARMAYRVRDDEWMARLSEIPDDTRDLTGRLMGDPIPQRSALAQRTAS